VLFWLICAALTLVIVLTIAFPLLRPRDATAAVPAVALYRAQLDEVERDVARGVLDAADAERTRAEIARRLIAAADSGSVATSAGPGKSAAITFGALLIAVAGLTYWQLGAPGYPDLPLAMRIENGNAARENRPTQAQAEAAAPAPDPVEASAEYLDSVAQLRELVPTRPDDIAGWQLLARHEAALRNFAAAARAQAEVVRIKGDAATLTDRMREVDLLVTAANGFVSRQSEDIVRAVLAEDETNIAARYYLGALYDQTDRPDIAFRLWRDLVEMGPEGGFHAAIARAQIEQAAFRAGITYTLPPETEVTEADIAGMVARLADRLATEGGPPTDWARLITAYGVLGQTDDARAIWTEAQEVFAGSDTAMTTLRAAAEQAGVAE
jgi:cytochrome c-type biogenesis protein CcmH